MKGCGMGSAARVGEWGYDADREGFFGGSRRKLGKNYSVI